jgi:DNA-binding NarL/FixJ family response regulator
LGNLKLLIVDDSELMCTHLAQILSEIEGLEILGVAFDAPDAFRYIEKVTPDVAILDICLPHGNGIDILKKIKKIRSSTKVIIYTHYPFPQYEKKCRQFGADYFFDKYTEFEKLLDVVKRLTRQLVFDADPAGSK